MFEVIRKLWVEGGVGRFYKGWFVAAAQVPITRFVDAAANDGMLKLFEGPRHNPPPFIAVSRCYMHEFATRHHLDASHFSDRFSIGRRRLLSVHPHAP